MKKLQLDEIAQIAEIVAALCVVASLAWVAIELRLNSAEIRQSNTMQLTTFTAANQMQAIGLGIAPIIAKTDAGETLSDNEIVQLTFWLRYTFQEFEVAHFQNSQHRIDPHLAAAWDRRLQFVVSSPVAQEYWQQEKMLYTDRFQEHVDSIIASINP